MEDVTEAVGMKLSYNTDINVVGSIPDYELKMFY